MNIQMLNAVDAAEKAFYTESLGAGSKEALSKAVSFGLPFSLYGFAVVFAVLILIMFIVILFGKAFGAAQNKSAGKSSEVSAPAPSQNVKMSAGDGAVCEDKGGIVAAIIAAITALRNANGEKGGFRVVSFKKRK